MLATPTLGVAPRRNSRSQLLLQLQLCRGVCPAPQYPQCDSTGQASNLHLVFSLCYLHCRVIEDFRRTASPKAELHYMVADLTDFE